MPSTTFTASRPGRLAVWREIRALRSHPPGRAGRGDRKRVFGSALEQAEQLLTAAGAVGYASRPILLFYGLSQAGRAIAAASTAADNNSYKLNGHGIKTLDLDQRPPLPSLTVKDDGLGSFTQLAQLLGSVSLRDGAPFGQLWATIPELFATPLEPMPPRHLPALRLQPVQLSRDHVPPGDAMWVAGLPPRPVGYRPADIDEEEDDEPLDINNKEDSLCSRGVTAVVHGSGIPNGLIRLSDHSSKFGQMCRKSHRRSQGALGLAAALAEAVPRRRCVVQEAVMGRGQLIHRAWRRRPSA